MTYSIHEALIDKLEKKLTTISNKCKQYGCEFHYEKIGEEFQEVETLDGEKALNRFILVEASGVAVINDWRFVAVIEHKDSGNVIRQYDFTLEVPSKYRTTKPICEHCGTLRNRKDTYLVYNDTTNTWKQVGKSCLRDFTNGLDAEQAVKFMSYTDLLEEYNNSCGGCYQRTYYQASDLLLYGVECVKHFGYVKAGNYDAYPTARHAFNLYSYIELEKVPPFTKPSDIEEEINRVNFEAVTEDNRREVNNMVNWVLEEDSSNNTYIHNLQVLVNSKYVSSRDINLLVSLVAAYHRHLDEVEKIKGKEAKLEAEVQSKHVGNIKDRITVDVASSQLVSSWDTQFGWSGMYKFIDTEGNVFIWITSCCIDVEKKMKLTGTVKEHSEFRGVKQTVLTRCKIQYEEAEKENVPDVIVDLTALDSLRVVV